MGATDRDDPQFLTVPEAARRIPCSAKTLMGLSGWGDPPQVKKIGDFGGDNFFRFLAYFTPNFRLRRLQAPQASFNHSRVPVEVYKGAAGENLGNFG